MDVETETYLDPRKSEDQWEVMMLFSIILIVTGETYADQQGIIAGWGLTSNNDTMLPNLLIVAQVTILNNSYCRQLQDSSLIAFEEDWSEKRHEFGDVKLRWIWCWIIIFPRDRREKKKNIPFLSMAKSIALSRRGDQEGMSTSTREEEDGLLVRDLAWKLDL